MQGTRDRGRDSSGLGHDRDRDRDRDRDHERGESGGRRRKKKPKGGKEGSGRERASSDASSHRDRHPIILSKTSMGEPKDHDRTPGSERGGRQTRPESPGPQFKIKTRDKESTSSQNQNTPSSSSKSSPGTPTKTISVATPTQQGRQGSDGDGKGREATSSGAARLYNPGQSVARGQIPGISIEVPIHKRLAAPPYMKEAVRLVDNSFQWVENGTEYLLDQSDFLVVGVLGMQGCGKSTLMSVLAGDNVLEDKRSSLVFQPQTLSTLEEASHQTSGLDMYITEERVILLDTQPILSSSILDSLLGADKQSLPPEFSTSEHYAEMQSLHIAAFLLTVCHVVIVIEDWFSDINLIEFLKRAEMLKPSTQPAPSSQSETSTAEELDDFVPNIVFVQNKCKRESFEPVTAHSMERVIHSLMATSKLKYTGCSSLARSGVLPCLNSKTLPLDVNLFIIPDLKPSYDDDTKLDSKLALLRMIHQDKLEGHVNAESILSAFRNQLYSASRPSLTHSTLTEKSWFQYASRNWEGLKKSSLLSEYHRLLT